MTRILILGLCLTASSAQAQKQAIEMKSGISYRSAKNGDTPDHWKLDLAVPGKGEGPYPLIVCVHGGGWRSGHRRQAASIMRQFAEQGFVATTVSYRLSNVAKFPAQIHDCKAALRFLRANAKKYKIDPKRVGAVGFSAGGHLVSLMGSTDKKSKLEGPGHLDQSSRVQAVASFFGPTDFIRKKWTNQVENFFLVPFFGGSYEKKKDLYKQASPIYHVTKDDPPYIFFHGDKDTLVGLYNSVDMANALKKVGVSAEVVVMKGSGHGWAGKKRQESFERTLKFFRAKLK